MMVALAGCSLNRIVADRLGDSLSGSGSVYASDDDPELIREAIPFSLKLMETVLAERPEHHDLLVAASRSFTQYAYAFVQEDADEIEDRNVAEAYRLRERARKLYRRARDYGLRGLDVTHAGFSRNLKANSATALAAPTDLLPKATTVVLKVPSGKTAAGGVVEIDPAHTIEEITVMKFDVIDR